MAAFETLCGVYWYPLYAFLRRKGCSPEDAEDLTQEFLARLIDKDALRNVSCEKGRFRSFLMAAASHFLADHRDKVQAQKRGGARKPLSLDAMSPEERYRLEPADALSPEEYYDRKWAQTVLDAALAALRAECALAGKAAQFDALKDAIVGEAHEDSYVKIATRAELSESAVKSRVSRLRLRFREFLRSEIAQTVADPAEIDGELRHLAAALSK